MFTQLLARAREARASELEGESGFEGGFTLIELMVVLLIIAILLAIAIPTFLGVTGSAKDRAAQSSLTNVLTESVATYQNNQSFPSSATITNYSSADPQFSWVNGAASTGACTAGANSAKCVSVTPVDVQAAGDAQGVVLAVLSSTGTCWWAVNLQANPPSTLLTTTTDTTGVPFQSTAVTTAGTFYAQMPSTSSNYNGGKNCYAAYSTTGAFKWGNSYANAGVN